MKDFTVTLTTAMLKQWNLQHLVMLFSLRLLLLLFSLTLFTVDKYQGKRFSLAKGT